jgi:hypothetical protein
MTTDTNEKYCPICGKPVTEPTYNRFGEWCCSEDHAEQYVKEVRAQKAQAVAAGQGRPVSPSGYEEGPWPGEEPEQRRSRRWRWFGRRRGGCC